MPSHRPTSNAPSTKDGVAVFGLRGRKEKQHYICEAKFMFAPLIGIGITIN